jgi:AraC family transcriptional regulator, transcriptional activator of pobA
VPVPSKTFHAQSNGLIVDFSLGFQPDDSSDQQDKSCIKWGIMVQPRVIPSYGLYGDQASADWSNSFNFEWIPQRSAPYQWLIQPHRHDAFFQLLYLTSGQVDFLMDDAHLQGHAPCVLVVPASHVHGFRFTPDVNGPVVTASQRALESVASVAMPELLPTIRKPRLITLQDEMRYADQLMPLFLALEQEARAHAPGHFAVGTSLLLALMVQVHRIVDALEGSGQTMQDTDPALSRQARQIERFRALVDRQHRQQKSLHAYASQLGMSAGQLSRLCRKALGMSGLDVIQARVLHEARRELVYTHLPIKVLASELGFDDDAYFSRFFRKHTGMSPTAYRERALQSMKELHRGDAAAAPPAPSAI